MMPALLTSTFSFGYFDFTSAASAAIAFGSEASLRIAVSFGCSFTAASRRSWLRPVMMTSLPSSTNFLARARPMPAPPPVTRMVFPDIFMTVLLGGCGSLLRERARGGRNRRAEERGADGGIAERRHRRCVGLLERVLEGAALGGVAL